MENQIVDNQFGLLIFIEDLDENHFWSGKGFFNNHNIDIHISVDNSYPTDKQKDWFNETHLDYRLWIPTIFGVLSKKLKHKYNFTDFEHFNKHFIPKAIVIPNLDKKEIYWSITFQSLDNKNHFLCVEFKNKNPITAFLET